MPFQIKDIKEFDEVINQSVLIVVHFSAKWAEQCTHINEILDELSKQDEYNNKVKFCVCEAEDLAEKSLLFHIEAAPTIVFFKRGVMVDRIDGADVTQLLKKVNQHNSVDSTAVPKAKLEERLKSLINKHSIMIFMKGNRENPRCGFSKQLIAIMNDTGVEYDTFDILQDEEIRQGLKVFSDWPTYPQLYVKGELIGGLDIIKELKNSGELETTLEGR